MKKQLLGLALLATAFWSCNSDKPVDLKFRLPQGETIRYTAETESDIDQTVMGNAMSAEESILIGLRYKGIDTAGDSRMVEVSYDRIRMESNAANQSLKYDSKDTMGNNPMLAIMGGIVGKPFRMSVSKIGEVLQVEGLNEALNSAAGDATNPNSVMVRQQLSQLFSDESVKQVLAQNTNIYPENPVRPGDTWKKKTTSMIGSITQEIENTYRLESATDKTAKVSINGVVVGKIVAGGAGAVQGMTINVKGKQTGMMDIEISTGMIERMDYKRDVDGNLEVQGMKVPMKIKTTGSIMGEKVK